MKTIRVFSIISVLLISISCANSQTSWTRQTSGTTETLHSVSFSDAITGWAAGNNGIVLNTSNGGAVWNSQNPGITTNLNSIHFINSSTGWVAGALGIIERTTNGGISWNIQQSGFPNLTLYSVYFTNSLSGFAVGFETDLGPAVAKTTNGGVLWIKLNYDLPAANTFNSVHFPSSSSGWIVTGGGRIYNTANGFILIPQVSGVTSALSSVFFTDNFNGYITGAGGVILRTFNGSTWFQVQTGVSADLNSVFFPVPSTGWTAGGAGTILKTSNSGVNWSAQNSGTTQKLRSIVFANSLTGWAVGDSGVIVNTTSGGTLTGINQVSNSVPLKHNLFQNYPNPFNPSTKIIFDVPQDQKKTNESVVKLVVYDVTGREVTTLVNEQLSPGKYEVNFNAAKYSSGVYYYRLSAQDFSEVKKMVLTK